MSAFIHWYLFRHLGPLRGEAPVAPVVADGEGDAEGPALWRSRARPEAGAWRPWLARRPADPLARPRDDGEPGRPPSALE